MRVLLTDGVQESRRFFDSVVSEAHLLQSLQDPDGDADDADDLDLDFRGMLCVKDVERWLSLGPALFVTERMDISEAVRWYVAGDHLQHRPLQEWSLRVIVSYVNTMNHSPLAESSRRLMEWFFEPDESMTFSSVVKRATAPTPGCRTPMIQSLLSVLRPDIAMTLVDETWEFRPCLASMFPMFTRLWAEVASLVDDDLQPFALAYFAHMLPSNSKWSVTIARMVAPLSRVRRVLRSVRPDLSPGTSGTSGTSDDLFLAILEPTHGTLTDTETSGMLGHLLVYLGVPCPCHVWAKVVDRPESLLTRRDIFASAKRSEFWEALLSARFVSARDAMEVAFELASGELFDMALERGLREEGDDFVVGAGSGKPSKTGVVMDHSVVMEFFQHVYYRLKKVGYAMDRVRVQFERYWTSPPLVWDILRLTEFRPHGLIEWCRVAELVPKAELDTFVRSIMDFDVPHCVGALGCVLARRPDVICRRFGAGVDASTASMPCSEQALLLLDRKFPGIWESFGAQGILLTLASKASEASDSERLGALETILAVLRHTGDQGFYAIVDTERDSLGLSLEPKLQADGRADPLEVRRWTLACEIFRVGFDPVCMSSYPGLYWQNLLRIRRSCIREDAGGAWSWLLPHLDVVLRQSLDWSELVTFRDWREAGALVDEWCCRDRSLQLEFVERRVANMCSGKWTRLGTVPRDTLEDLEREMGSLIRNELVTDEQIVDCLGSLWDMAVFVEDVHDVASKTLVTLLSVERRKSAQALFPGLIRTMGQNESYARAVEVLKQYVVNAKATKRRRPDDTREHSEAVRLA